MKGLIATTLTGALWCCSVAFAESQGSRAGSPLRGATPDSRVRFDAIPFLGEAPLAVQFDATRSGFSSVRPSTRPGLIEGEENLRRVNGVQYIWEFGDGAMALGARASHTYSAPGQYEVKLTILAGGALFAGEPFFVTASDGSFSLKEPVTPNEARRFLWQAAFGPRPADVSFIVANGFEAWIDAQKAMAPTLMTVAQLNQSIAQSYGYGPESLFDDLCVEAPDQLRQRVAWALLQVLVMNNPQDTADADTVYYASYIQRALGNYRDLLGYVTRSHQMGVFLTYINNLRANPQAGTVPDENYAREVMQLFTIGLWTLNPDGTRALDALGRPIPTFDNADVQQFARIFTGFRWGAEFADPMPMIPGRHEFGAKQLLDYPGAVPPGGFIPAITQAGQQTEPAAQADIDAALDNLFHHPNCAPFISKLLIKRLVTSNPTPGYVQRVAQTFEGFGAYGSGVRGDLGATVKAILLDNEARDPAYRANPFYGAIREPLVTRWGLYRTLERVDRPAEVFPFRIAGDTYQAQLDFGQSFLGSPSVFNFYLPSHVPPLTRLAPFEMTSPELQIFNDYTALATQNRFHDELVIRGGATEAARYAFWRTLAPNPASLVSALNDELMCGVLSTESRQVIEQAIQAITGNTDRVRSAVWLIVNSPEFRTLR